MYLAPFCDSKNFVTSGNECAEINTTMKYFMWQILTLPHILIPSSVCCGKRQYAFSCWGIDWLLATHVSQLLIYKSSVFSNHCVYWVCDVKILKFSYIYSTSSHWSELSYIGFKSGFLFLSASSILRILKMSKNLSNILQKFLFQWCQLLFYSAP